MTQFRKMHGLGNDFVILDFRKDVKALSPAMIEHICDRNFGVGCDQLVIMEPSKTADVFARFYNSDGSESAACGNATRCVAEIIMSEQDVEQCTIETGRGMLPCTRSENNMITVDMGAPISIEDLDLVQGSVRAPVSVNMGNPHCVFFVESLVDTPVEKLGAAVEQNSIFPNKTNVEFVEILSDAKMRQKTWERGVGMTLACGSGACAVAVAGAHSGRTGRKTEIELDGGTLYIEYRTDDDHVLMTGPVAYVFDGTLANI